MLSSFRNHLQYHLQHGKLFRRYLSDLRKTESLAYKQLLEHQSSLLQEVVAHAYRAIPYYQEFFRQNNIKPGDINSLESLKLLPIIRKHDLRGNEELFASKYIVPRFKKHTSGTTGTPLTLFRDLENINFENAILWRQRSWANVKLNARGVTLRGAIVVPVEQEVPPFWTYNSRSNTLIMSSYHLSHQFIPDYLKVLRDFQPNAIYAYPSSIYALACYMQENNEKAIPVNGVFTSSEILYDNWKQLIEQYFGQVFDYYGNAERVAHIGMCEFGKYHYTMDYSIIEFIPIEDNKYEVVGTTLHNRAMPLIRYATGDTVQLEEKNDCPCGRAFPLIKTIEGRQDDYLVTPSGKRIGGPGLTLLYWGIPHIVESQIIQNELNSVEVLVVPTKDFSSEDKNTLAMKLKERLGSDINIHIQCVENIPRTISGKFKLVISKISQNM